MSSKSVLQECQVRSVKWECLTRVSSQECQVRGVKQEWQGTLSSTPCNFTVAQKNKIKIFFFHDKESADSEVYFHVNCTGGGQTEFLLLWIFVCWPSLFSLISWEILGIGWLIYVNVEVLNFGCWPILFSLISWEILGIGWLTVAKKTSMLKKVLILRFTSMSIALGGSDWIFAALDFCVLAKFVFLDFLRNLGHWMVNGSEKNPC